MSEADSVAFLNQTLAGRYHLEREIGVGGMATVYLALDVRHQRPVAVKVLRPGATGTLGPDRFLREIQVTAGLDHPNIVTLLDSGESGGVSYYVLPYVRGESLKDLLVRDGRLPIADAVRISREVAAALQYAHQRGVIHRDVKPANILIDGDRVRLADFGIAIAVGSVIDRLTTTGVSVGTADYMSPEQAAGERDLDARSDVFSLGATLFEMLTGERPFPGTTPRAVVARILTEKPVDPRLLRPSLSRSLCDIVLKALQHERDDRFGTAREFGEALALVGSGAAVANPRSVEPHRRRRFAIAVSLATLAVVGLAAVAVWLRDSNGRLGARPTTVSPSATQQATPIGTLKTVVVPLRYRRASEFLPLVRSIVSDSAGATADTIANAIVIRDLDGVIDQRIAAVRQLDSLAASRVGAARDGRASVQRQPQLPAVALEPVPAGKQRVALVDFGNRTVGRLADTLQNLRKSIPELIGVELSASLNYQVVEPFAGASASDSSDLAIAAAAGRRVNASWVVFGNYFGDASGRLRINARLVDVRTGQSRWTETIEDRHDSALQPIKTLGRRLLCDLDTIALRQVATCDRARSDVAMYSRQFPPAVQEKTMKSGLDAAGMKLFNSGLDAMDAKNYAKATGIFSEVIQKYPAFEPARRYFDRVTARPSRDSLP